MASRVFLYLGLLVAIIVLLISSKVAARDLAETATDSSKVNGAKFHPDEGCGAYNGVYGRLGSNGRLQHRPPTKRRTCPFGCCGYGGYGIYCSGCWSYAGEPMHAKTPAKPKN